MRLPVKAFAKGAIALVVIAGLGFAIKKSFDSLSEQQQRTVDLITQIDRKIESAKIESERQRLRQELQDVIDQQPSFANVHWSTLAAAALVYAVGLIPGGLVLKEASGLLGKPISVRDAVSIQTVGHLGKYVPGKAMVVVIRAGRLRELGASWLIGSTAVFLETIMMMAVGAALAGGLIFFLPVPRWIAWISLLSGMSAAMISAPPILSRLLQKANILKSDSSLTDTTVSPTRHLCDGWRFFSLAWCWHVSGWFLIGGSFALVVRSLPGSIQTVSDATLIIASVAAMSLAMVVGFASLLPGGAGVRELTLTIVLAPVAGPAVALMSAIVIRLVFIAVEVSLAGLLGGWRNRPEKRPQLSS
ncbi:lysylphosphatidylglycerol synthase transmembrane domain-containing protein [Roseiconus lacunae]|uniref:lysylphosphatidylglycerol synthase transmembrane domain-containing protein n=1 Tax=Roseiconus lacunae TaxID=2605694 RepID=UPI001E46D797|nr:lysylphosphatidylglycerol synthase domain-containing protein [Roseiconus lacunae]MCD0461680.1 flippase-like domain-containing protein [Roseiconus lacunae]